VDIEERGKPTTLDDRWIVRDSTPTIGRDRNGRLASFIVVQSRDFHWKLGSRTEIVRLERIEDIEAPLRGPEIARQIERFSALVMIGAASHENSRERPLDEDKLARDRADQMQLFVKKKFHTPRRIYSISLGYNRNVVSGDKSDKQRLLVILGIISMQEGVNLGEALRDALPKVEAFPFRLEDYSQFEFEQWR